MKKAFFISSLVLIVIITISYFVFNKQYNMTNEPTKIISEVPGESINEEIANLPADATIFKVVPERSRLEWQAERILGDPNHTGIVVVKSGQVAIINSEIISGNIILDMTTITDNDLTNDRIKQTLENHIKSADFFDVNNFPEAKLKITQALRKDKDSSKNYEITADLTIKDITNRINFPASLEFNDKEVKARAEITIDRTDWDVRYGSDKFFKGLGDKVIKDEINFKIDIVAIST